MKRVDIKGLDFSYAGSKCVLSGIDLDVDPGEFVCILGHSGCGKSTLLRLIAGLEQPTVGSIMLDGSPVMGAGLDRGVVFQDYGLYPWMSTGKNITLALEQSSPEMSRTALKIRATEMLLHVGLTPDVLNKLPKELSGGMQQRCAIAQALAIDPPVLLMDEPFGALDSITRAKLQDLVRRLWGGDPGSEKPSSL
jgi:NitT/TauT family transport system ATP-binding protein